MDYNFKKNNNWVIIDINNPQLEVLYNLSGGDWTALKIQKIKEGIEQSIENENQNTFEWANEDVLILSNKKGVYFWSLLARRANKDVINGEDLFLSHEETLVFLQDFIAFLNKAS